jgi:nitrogen regulatory protein PII
LRPLASLDLIVTIVPKGQAEKIVRASKKAGAEGGTVLYGRGTGIREHKTLFGLSIEPEKEIVLTLVPDTKTDRVLEAVVEAGQLDRPGTGIGFVLDARKIVGINHLINLYE